MKKILIIVGGILGVIVAVVIVALVYLWANLGDLIEAAVEEYGPRITKTAVSLSSVEIDPADGKGALNGLFLGNPKGFKTNSALKLNRIAINLDINSVTSNPIIINQILIISPEVTYEIGDKGSNFDAIKRNVDRSLKELAGPGKKGGSKDSSGSGEKKIIIKELIISKGVVNASMSALQGKTLSAPLPTIRLTNIGKKTNGATAAQAVSQVMNALTRSAKGAVAKLDLKALGDVGKKASDAAKSVTEGAGKKATDSLKKLIK